MNEAFGFVREIYFDAVQTWCRGETVENLEACASLLELAVKETQSIVRHLRERATDLKRGGDKL
jgi:hypothetical protein